MNKAKPIQESIKGLGNSFNKSLVAVKKISVATGLSLYCLTYIPFAGAAEAANKPSGFEQFFPFILIGFVFYFLLIRPQQKRFKMHKQFLSEVKRGDEVLTNSGIFGKIEGLTDQFIILEVAEDVKIRILKNQIASFVGDTAISKNNKDK